MPLTKEAVVATAMQLLDDFGLPALSIRRIAAALNVRPGALYWHFENKQALLGALADQVLSGLEAQSRPLSWREAVVELTLRVRAALLSHRDGADLVATAAAFDVGGRRLFECLEATIGRGDVALAARDVAVGTHVLGQFILGATMSEQQLVQAAAWGAVPAGQSVDAVTAADGFLRGVELIVDGLELRILHDQ